MGWGPEEIRSLRELAEAGLDDAAIAREMDLSIQAIGSLRRKAFPVPAQPVERAVAIPTKNRGGAPGEWTDDRVAKMKDLYAKGWTASAITSSLGGISRNAVIGKVHRLGLTRGGTVIRKVATIPKERQAKPAPRPKIKVANDRPKRISHDEVAPFRALPHDERTRRAFTDLAPDGSRGVSVLELRNDHCRWPMGDMMAVSTRFCGGKKVDACYCAHHRAMAYVPAPVRTSQRSDRREGALR